MLRLLVDVARLLSERAEPLNDPHDVGDSPFTTSPTLYSEYL